ncbi:pyruvate kinase [Nitrosococcus halophilus Nc 4]|uniref:Pyruvate kinase n=1 Tax=Nitrosococcus halophilus (strain Nc4) TaxID=472759 RepID=D5BYP4_NITHN|nr:pyruvate kinase [Nitrosococcus halophilus]ADE16032.1 pyruvate kinase [Nitrosococcus halophilus Nc 4]
MTSGNPKRTHDSLFSPFKFEKNPRACRIICTIGPSSQSPAILEKMLLSGMNVARLNFSHGSQESHGTIVHEIRKTAQRLMKPIAILQDLQGHKVRVGSIQHSPSLCLNEDQEILLGHGETVSNKRIGIDYQGITDYVAPGQHIFLDDGSIELEVLSTRGDDLHCRVKLGGELSSRKGVIFPDSHLSFPLLNEKDENDAHFGVFLNVDMVAMSFVRSATEIIEMRLRLAAWGKRDSFIVAKIEDRKGIDNLDEILHVADAVLIARGDLGVTLPREKVPGIQKTIIQKTNAFGVPVITATQMLESMIYHDKPTRAEVNDVYSAVMGGSDAVMLSGETASGRYPLHAVREMDRICREAEKELRSFKGEIPVRGRRDMHDKMAASAVNLARNTKARCILAFSLSGATLKALSTARSNVPVYGVVVEERVLRQLLLHWGHSLITMPHEEKLEDLIGPVLKQLQEQGIVRTNDRIVVMASEAEPGAKETYLFKLYLLK